MKLSCAAFLLKLCLVEVQALTFQTNELVLPIDERKGIGRMTVEVINDSEETIHVALSFNQTLKDDETPFEASATGGGLPRVKSKGIDYAVKSIFRIKAPSAPRTLVLTLDDPSEKVLQYQFKVSSCLEAHHESCGFKNRRKDTQCSARTRLLPHTRLLVLSYSRTWSKCQEEDLKSDLAFVQRYFTIVDAEVDSKSAPGWDSAITKVVASERDFQPQSFDSVGQEVLEGDPELINQWSMAKSHILEAWKEIGSWPDNYKPIVSIIDSGVNLRHPDLSGNLWINDLELNGEPGVDDDNNGYVDDIYGWVAGQSIGHEPNDTTGHGTHMAGVIGALVNNGIGVAGIAGPNVKLAVCRRNPEVGSPLRSHDSECLDWSSAIGAQISVNGYHSASRSPYTFPSKRRVFEHLNNEGRLYVGAAGNEGMNLGPPAAQPYSYDICYNYPNFIGVCSLDTDMKIASGSNYGQRCVTVGAPGSDIIGLLEPKSKRDEFVYLTSSSSAAAHMAGIAALLLNVNPYLDAIEMKRIIRASITPLTELRQPKTLFGGSPNVVNAIRLLRPENLLAEDGSRWDDLRFNLKELSPGDRAKYTLIGSAPEELETILGSIVAYRVDPKANLAVKERITAPVRAIAAPETTTTPMPDAISEPRDDEEIQSLSVGSRHSYWTLGTMITWLIVGID